ncbi:Histidine kinase [Tenacibaculum sp. 190524A02b]|uniref:sensor histidine kinase n=1 Tax=Tenacibaculum vairaonense TaxID=3137860 RepID=UPI0032B1C545
MIAYVNKHRHFFLFLFAFCWLLSLKNKIAIALGSWEDFYFHFDAPFWMFFGSVIIFFFVDFIKRKVEKRNPHQTPRLKNYIGYFGIGFIAYMLYQNISGILISYAFNNLERNYGSSYLIISNNVGRALNFLMFGGLSLAYLYFQDTKNYKKQISEFQISNAKSKIQQLQNQLNPHFLFNNLNILDQLIFEDSVKASTFLSRFSEVYRFSLANSSKELILLQEELSFTENYFKLMEEKYQDYYQLVIDDQVKKKHVIVPPFCLQVLVENVIMHNLGTQSNPVTIRISFDNGIVISNNKIALNRKKKGNGVALKNLNEQFLLMSQQPIEILETSETFTVHLPLIKTVA